jgi:hypothetical protein
VLNRDVSTNVTQLLGKLNSESSVAVWVHNPNGILVGSKAAFDTGSLVLSTLDISPEDFVAANNRFRLRAPANGEQSAITVAEGATFEVNGQTRGLVMLAPKIDAHGEFIAQGQDVAFVSAADVTLDYRTGSPLSVTINRGTAVPRTSQYVRGTVQGNNALFALASQDTLTDSLLQVSAEVTTASAGSRGIVLSAGRTATAVDGVTLGGDVAATGGLADVLIDGTLRTQGGNAAVTAGASRAITVAGGIETRSDVTIAAGGLLTITGGIGAGDDVRLSGTGITLGRGDDVAVRAADQLLLSSTDGNIVGTGAVTLQSGSSGNDSLVVETRGTTGGSILLGSQSRLIAGEDRGGALTLRLRSAANAVSIGNVDARGLRSGIGTSAAGDGLRVTGSAAIGNVNLREALTIEAAGITGGTLASDRSVSLRSTGAIGVAGLNARAGSVTATATGAVTVIGAVRASGSGSDVRIDTPGAVTLDDVSAGRDLLVGSATRPSTVTVGGAVAAGRTYQIDAGGIVLGDGTDVSQGAEGAVRLTAGSGGITGRNGLTLAADGSGGTAGLTLAIDPAAAAGADGVIDFAPGTTLLGGTDRQSDVRIRSAAAGGSVRLGQVRARGLLGAVGTAQFTNGLSRAAAVQTGAVSLRNDIALTGTTVTAGALTSTQGAVRVAGTSGDVQTGAVVANGNVTLTAPGVITTGALTSTGAISADATGALTAGGSVSGGGAVTLRGASVTLGGAAVRSGRSIDILARTGGIGSPAAVAIVSSSSETSDFIRLQAGGAEGIAFAPGSAIVGGSDRQVGVRVFTAADAPLVLGDVTARSLGTLAQLGGNPLAAGGAFRSQDSLAFGRLNLVDGFVAESIGGDLSVREIAVTGAGQGIDLRAAGGTLSVQSDMTASGAMTLTSGAALTLGSVQSLASAVSISSAAALTAGTLDGATGVSANASSLTLGEVRGGAGAVTLTAAAGDLALGDGSGRAMTLRASGGAIDATGSLLATNGAIDAEAGGSIRVGGTVTATGGGVRLQATNGGLAVTGGVLADGRVSLAGTSAALAAVESRNAAVSIASAGNVRTGALNAGAGVTAEGAALSLGAVEGGSGAVALTALRGDLALGGASGTGLTVRAARGAIDSTGSLVATNGAVAAEAAEAISSGGVSATGGGVRLQSTSGALTVAGSILADGAVTLAGTAATLGAVESRDAGISLASIGNVQTGALTAATGVTANGAALSLGDVEGGSGAVSLTATSGDLALGGASGSAVTLRAAAGGITASGPLLTSNGKLDAEALNGITADGTINALGGGVRLQSSLGVVSAAGGLSSDADVALVGSSVRIGGEHRARGAYSATASASGIQRAGDSASVRSDSDSNGGEGLSLTASGGAIDLPGVTLGGGAVTLNTDGAGIVIGAVDAARLIASGATASGSAIRTGNLTLGTALSLDAAGDVTTGAVSVADGAVSIISSAGDVSTQAITASGAVALSGNQLGFGEVIAAGLSANAAAGALTGGDVSVQGGVVATTSNGPVTLGRVTSTGGNIAIAANGNLFARAVNAGGAATIVGTGAGNDVTIAEGVAAEGPATVRSARDIRTPFIRSRMSDLTVAAPNGRVAGFAPGSGIDLAAGPSGAFSLTVGTDALLGDVIGGNIAITATSITANRIEGGTEAVSLRATAGDLRVMGPVVGGDITLTSVANTVLGTVDALGAVTIGGDQSLSFDSVSGRSINASGGAIDGGAVRSPGANDMRGGDITLGPIEAGGAFAVDATNGLEIESLVASGQASLSSGGAADFGTISAAGALTIGAKGALSFDQLSGGSITARGAAIAGDTVMSPGKINLAASRITLERIDAGSALTATAAEALAIETIAASGATTLVSGGTGTFNTVAAGGALALEITGDLSFTQLSGGSIDATASAGAVRGTDVRSPGVATIRGIAVDLGAVSAGAFLADATGGAASLGAITSLGDVTVRAVTSATITGVVSAAGAYRVTAGTIALGGDGIVQRADGEVRLTTSSGMLRGGPGLQLVSGAGAIALDSAGGIDFAGTTITAQSGGSALALRAGSGQAIRLGTVEAGSIGGFDGNAAIDRLTHDAAFTAGDVTSGRVAVTLTGGDLTIGRLGSSGIVSLAAVAGAIALGEVAAGSFDAKAGSTLSLGAATIAGRATLEAGSITLPSIAAQSLAIRTAGALTGVAGAGAGLSTTGGDLEVEAASARLADVQSAGAATLRGGTIAVAGRLAAARQLLVDARDALTIGTASAGGDLTLKSAAGASADALDASGALVVEGRAGVRIASARSGGALRVTTGGDLALGAGTAGGGIGLEANGLARIGALSGGPSVTIRAADAELTGAVRAASVRFATADPATMAMRIGDGAANGGFRLSATEVGLVAADRLAFDAGMGALEIGTLALTPGIGRSVEMLSTGDIRVTGQLSSSGGAQSIRLGGNDADGNAQTIHVVATSNAGGRLMLENADLELRGNRIAVGLAPGFIDTLLPGDPGRAQAAALIGNANSALYNPQLGGGFYAPAATTTIAAQSLTVRFGDYALFQNTAVPGQASGVMVGGPAGGNGGPATTALRVSSFGAQGSPSFALFGSLNGFSGASAALLGNPVIDIEPTLLPNSRINGCLAQSGTGCLTTIVIQPTLQVFNWNSAAVFGILQDVALPFTPVISGNNEELLSGLPALAPEEPDAAPPAAEPQEPKP